MATRKGLGTSRVTRANPNPNGLTGNNAGGKTNNDATDNDDWTQHFGQYMYNSEQLANKTVDTEVERIAEIVAKVMKTCSRSSDIPRSDAPRFTG